MKTVGLISGGKDSCFALLESVRHGHEIVALANLYPPSDGSDELDSFMFQTVGVEKICPAIAECMGLPLIRMPLRGKSVHCDIDYKERCAGDEVEDLFELLTMVKEQYPEVQAVCSGAVLSTYQRNRVENVCERLGLTSLAYLWQRTQDEVLESMINSGVDAVLIKIASMGLKPSMLGRRICELQPRFRKLNEEFGFHVCGEGGEYETVTLDSPLFKHGHIVLDKVETVIVEDNDFSPVAHLRIQEFHIEPRDPEEVVEIETLPGPTLEQPVVNINAETSLALLPSPPQCPMVWKNESVINVYGCQSETIDDAMNMLRDKLSENGFNLQEIFFVHLYVSNMDDFGSVNERYCTYFGANPPSRACVQLDMMAPDQVCVCAMASKLSRKVLHVKSMSSWAPVCIGPYAQSNTLDEKLCFIAGQIALDPPTMRMAFVNDRTEQFRLAQKHCNAVASCQNENFKFLSCLVYMTEPVDNEFKTLVETELDNVDQVIFVQVPRLPRNARVELEMVAGFQTNTGGKLASIVHVTEDDEISSIDLAQLLEKDGPCKVFYDCRSQLADKVKTILAQNLNAWQIPVRSIGNGTMEKRIILSIVKIDSLL